MCARYTLTKKDKALVDAYVAKVIDPFNPDANIAPTDGGLIIRADAPNEIHNYHFGLVPWFSKDTKAGFKNVNARNDSLLTSGQWKPLMEKGKRCLVLADGFYEWEKAGGEKLPWRFTLTDRDLFAFAGLYSTWVSQDKALVYHSFSIITTEPNSLLDKFHNRMPVILTKEEEKQWLSTDVPVKDLVDICNQQYPADLMDAYRVSKSVNITRGGTNKGIELILPENSK
jgi:putative SOS response-associated peptidase YedK